MKFYLAIATCMVLASTSFAGSCCSAPKAAKKEGKPAVSAKDSATTGTAKSA